MLALTILSWICAFFGVMTLSSGAIEKRGTIPLTILIFIGPVVFV